MEENPNSKKNSESEDGIKIRPETLPEQFREFYSSPCSMGEFEEEIFNS